MILTYEGKKTEEEILNSIKDCKLKSVKGNTEHKSKLIKGENLEVLKYLLNEGGLKGKVDLIYIDPPFSTNNIFTISKDKANSISRSNGDNIAYDDSLNGHEFLEFIRQRLILLRELLSENGSIYFHIDYKIGHYIKILMDEVFGKNNFLNDLTRIKCNPKNFSRKAYGNVKDMVLFYSKTGNHIWNNPKEEQSEEEIARLFKKVDKEGRSYTTVPVHAPGETANGPTGKPWRGMMPPKGRHWRSAPEVLEELDKNGLIEWSKNGVPRKKVFADEKDGKIRQDIWEFKDLQKPSYPTEKNLDLLKVIINASSKPESIVLDCFCGSGTTLKAAQELGRTWIGIDKSDEAINVALSKLHIEEHPLLKNTLSFEYLEQEDC
jgi:adenine-specific DNA-methyltransferase